ncbi:hypothetical protein F5Y04DRAFT_263352 [Hypomontagnella monticulosa]|nr:hypothetical protein F5Y04DRAFT_263352 [Hypomontagnella monticulosa]
MPLSTSPTTAPLSTRVKMEDRKRPAISSTDDIAPPSKRQAVNGSSKSKDDTDVKEEAWIEVSVIVTTYSPRINVIGRTVVSNALSSSTLDDFTLARDLRSLCFKLSSGHSTHHLSTDARLCCHQRTIPPPSLL